MSPSLLAWLATTANAGDVYAMNSDVTVGHGLLVPRPAQSDILVNWTYTSYGPAVDIRSIRFDGSQLVDAEFWNAAPGAAFFTAEMQGTDQLLINAGINVVEPSGATHPCQPQWESADINGDGLREVFCGPETSPSIILSTAGIDPRWLPVTAPYPGQRVLPISDVTGDGNDDVLSSAWSNPKGGTNTLTLWPGASDGVAAALWSVDTQYPVDQAVALQADADPELEVLFLTGSMSPFIGIDMFQLGLVNDVAGAATITIYAEESRAGTANGSPVLHNLGDLTGDGTDDILLGNQNYTSNFPAPYSSLVLAGDQSYSILNPLVVLREQDALSKLPAGFGSLRTPHATVDLNGDGLLDVVGYFGHYYESVLVVWLSPLYEPPAHTGDTGQTTADTSTVTGDTAAHTSDTATQAVPTVDTATTSPPGGTVTGGGGRCGCASSNGAWYWTMLLPLVGLRRRPPSAAKPSPST